MGEGNAEEFARVALYLRKELRSTQLDAGELWNALTAFRSDICKGADFLSSQVDVTDNLRDRKRCFLKCVSISMALAGSGSGLIADIPTGGTSLGFAAASGALAAVL